MEVQFSPGFNKDRKERISRISMELPVTIFGSDNSEVVPIVRDTHSIRKIKLLVPPNSRVELYDGDLCELLKERSFGGITGADHYVVFARPNPEGRRYSYIFGVFEQG
tara:strand:+ start:49 stop:372 length:324 start_codon:yes stop_codon:yes gene_type:complete